MNAVTADPMSDKLVPLNLLPHPILKAGLRVLPSLSLLFALFHLVFFPNNTGAMDESRLDILQITNYLMLGVSFIIAWVVIEQGANLFVRLQQRGVFMGLEPTELQKFIARYSRRVNDLTAILIIMAIVLIWGAVNTIISCRAQQAEGLSLLFCNYGHGVVRASKSVADIIALPFAAIFIWKSLAIGYGLQEFGRKINFNLNWNHPDKCCGLKPIGELCLWLSFIPVIPAIFWASWVTVCDDPMNAICQTIPRVVDRIHSAQGSLLVAIVISFFIFILPLWNVHLAMQEKRNEIHQKNLPRISRTIDALSKQMTTNTLQLTELQEKPDGEDPKTEEANTQEENERLKKQLGLLQESYTTLENIPVWPFDGKIVKNLLGSQIVPLLGLTGIGSRLMDVLKILFPTP